MPTPPLSDEKAQEALDAFTEHGVKYRAAKALGLDQRTFANRLNKARERGLHVSPGIRSVTAGAGLNIAEARGGWIHSYDEDGKKIGATHWRMPEVEQEQFLDRFREMLESIKPAEPVPVPETLKEDSLCFVPDADVHVGLVVTEDETGHQPYNREIARQRFMAGASECITAIHPSHTCLIASMGDLTHADNNLNVTPRSKHTLRVEGTHFDNIFLSAELLFYKVDLALQHHTNIVVEVIGGNHDPHTPGPILLALQQRYREEPRVTVNVSQNEWWARNWGDVFLCGHHGDKRKVKDVCASIPGKFPKQWGAARQWHYFSAHLHGYKVQQEGSVMHHQLPAVCGLDTHAAYSPYNGESGMVALRFDKKRGLRQTHLIGL